MTFSVRRPTTRPRPGDRSSNPTRPEKNEGETSFLFILVFRRNIEQHQRRLCCSLTIVNSIVLLDLAVYICIIQELCNSELSEQVIQNSEDRVYGHFFVSCFFFFFCFFFLFCFLNFFIKFPRFPNKNRGWEAFRRQAACVRNSSARLRCVFHLRLLLYFCFTVLPDL